MCLDEDGELFFDIELQDASFDLMPGVGGSVEGDFLFPSGVSPGTGFLIELFSFANGVALEISSPLPGVVLASVNPEGNEQAVTTSTTDISALMAGETAITLRLEASSGNLVTASLDFGSDGLVDLVLPGTASLLAGASYHGGFGVGLNTLEPMPALPGWTVGAAAALFCLIAVGALRYSGSN